MKFLCDVHISIKLVKFLISKNHDCIHVNTILDKWYTKDQEIAKYADENSLILITKDADFSAAIFKIESSYVHNSTKAADYTFTSQNSYPVFETRGPPAI